MSVDKKGLDDIPGNSRPASIDATQEPAQCLENDDRAGSDALGQQDTEAGLEKRPSTIVPYTIYNLTQKRLLVTLVSIAGFFSPLNSNIYFPAIPQIAQSLGRTTEQINLTVTIYLVFQGVSPSLWGSLADVVGRRPIYIITLAIYIVANLGLALVNVYWAVMLLRIFQAVGSAATIALGAGTISDISTPSERGFYVSIFQMGVQLGPALGPLFGGLLSDHFGWHSIFWFLVIIGSPCLIAIIFFLPETSRKIAGNGSIPVASWRKPLWTLLRGRRSREDAAQAVPPERKLSLRDIHPLKPLLMLLEPDMAMLLFFNGVVYTAYYCATGSLSSLLDDLYGYSQTEIGLCFLAIGGGALGGSLVMSRVVDRDFRVTKRQQMKKLSAQTGESLEKLMAKPLNQKDPNDLRDFPIEHARLRCCFWLVPLYVAALIGNGWTLQARTHIAGPLILQFVIGLAGFCLQTVANVLVIDLYPAASATSSAAVNLVRCCMGAVGLAVIDSMIRTLGVGWTFTFWALLLVICVPLLFALWKYGMVFRLKRGDRISRTK